MTHIRYLHDPYLGTSVILHLPQIGLKTGPRRGLREKFRTYCTSNENMAQFRTVVKKSGAEKPGSGGAKRRPPPDFFLGGEAPRDGQEGGIFRVGVADPLGVFFTSIFLGTDWAAREKAFSPGCLE
jgi:hypothetical protein